MDRLLEFAGNHPLLITMAIMLTVLVIVNELRLMSRRGIDLTPAEAVQFINDGAMIIDVRSIERFRTGHIVNARNIPFDELAGAVAGKLKGHEDKPVITYDDAGFIGAKAASLLRKLAFAKAANLRGGLVAWQRDNLPLETG
jgi:rhodanese-related sulfurtransferase